MVHGPDKTMVDKAVSVIVARSNSSATLSAYLLFVSFVEIPWRIRNGVSQEPWAQPSAEPEAML